MTRKFSIDDNVFEFFCVFLYTDYESDICRKFQVATPFDVDSNYQIGFSQNTKH